ncbi:Thiosulfate-binding protein [Frankliniella fusca]|uniref:Thiosulfate-binding protein n=1 Tax=Frankliniella fusca TaxID=407009 RepID=A0AAE1I2A5_9NEOP|nr:Thiosulfate-binding protein [Frankliniella fusca]
MLPAKRAKKSTVKQLILSSSESGSEDDPPPCKDSCSEWEEEGDVCPIDRTNFPPLKEAPKEGNYILVEFVDKKSKVYYIGKVLKEEDDEGDFEVTYLRRSLKVKDKFCLPNVADLKSVHRSDVKLVLPSPTCSGTKRQQNLLHFDCDLSLINVK